MIYTIEHVSKKLVSTVKAFLKLKPVPQVSSWIQCAKRFAAQGFYYEASAIMDSIAMHYGREVARKAWNQFSHIPIEQRGFGIGEARRCIDEQSPPSLHLDKAFIKTSEGIRYTSIVDGYQGEINLFFLRKGFRLPEAYKIAVSNHGVFTFSERNVYRADHAQAEFVLLKQLEEPILRVSSPLEDGSVLILTAPKLPVFSPDCSLVNWVDGALTVLHLPNTAQNLVGDCVAWGNAFVMCGGGMQANEVRFLAADGSWTTRLQHKEEVLRMARSERGPVSIDKSGLALLWDSAELQVIDHKHLQLDKLPKEVIEDIETYDASMDWERGVLYLSRPKETSLMDHLASQETWQLNGDKLCNNAFVTQLFPSLNGLCLASLRDGQFHWWDLQNEQVTTNWQLPLTCATAEELVKLIKYTKIGVDDDPRLRDVKWA